MPPPTIRYRNAPTEPILVERGCEPTPVGRRDRVILPEVVEDGDGQVAPAIALVGRRLRDPADQELERALGIARLERSEDVGLSVARSSSRTPSMRGGASSLSTNAATRAGGCAPTNSATTRPSRKPFTAGMPWTRRWPPGPGSRRRPLREGDRLFAALHLGVEHRRERVARAAPRGPEVDDHGVSRDRFDHVLLEGLLGDVHVGVNGDEPPRIILSRRRADESRHPSGEPGPLDDPDDSVDVP
jgi:hypothetical protein